MRYTKKRELENTFDLAPLIMLANFVFNSVTVRVVLRNNEPWWVAKDVAEVLEYADPSKMFNLVDSEDKITINPRELDSASLAETLPENTFRLVLINESGLYACIFGSNKPTAKQFKKWVTSEVLPSIRRTGSYSAKKTHTAIEYIEAAEKVNGFGEDIPEALKQLLLDALGDELCTLQSATNQLPEQTQIWMGVAQIAENLGHKINESNRGKLGKYVKNNIRRAGIEGKREKRLCNGQLRPIWIYPQCREVEELINEYFSYN